MKNQYRFTNPPHGLRQRHVQLENFSLVPASLLADISQWQSFADQQPHGTAVMVMSSPTSPLRRVYRSLARVLAARGKTAKLYSAYT